MSDGDMFTREPWTPGGQAALEQLQAKAIDELRASDTFFLAYVRTPPFDGDEWGGVIAGSMGGEEAQVALLWALEHAAGELRANLEAGGALDEEAA